MRTLTPLQKKWRGLEKARRDLFFCAVGFELGEARLRRAAEGLVSPETIEEWIIESHREHERRFRGWKPPGQFDPKSGDWIISPPAAPESGPLPWTLKGKSYRSKWWRAVND